MGSPLPAVLTLLAMCIVSAQTDIDLNKPPENKIYLDAYGGDPITKQEVGAVPQNMDDPEIMFPTIGTCKQKGVLSTECSQDCLWGCKTPECSMSCLCACGGEEAKARLVSELKQVQGRMIKEQQLLGKQQKLWSAVPSQLAQQHKVPQKLHRSNFKAQQRHAIHRRSATAAAGGSVDKTGFNWVTMESQGSPSMVRMAQSPYGKEADQLDDVFDPTMDPTNRGRRVNPVADSTDWWAGETKRSMGDRWWSHAGEEGR
mmetsp:Transcript_8989/g.20961  ORF Transcript_8989/g.20961 Transcript_8989/m.20961 type:complete len:258 (+) Transcript_8989:3-776(+)